MTIKPSAFSHSWYPGSPEECERTILAFNSENDRRGEPVPKTCIGGIVPHAGWVFSGRIAARVIRALAPQGEGEGIDTIVLFGGHMRSSDPAFILASGGVDTPLSAIEADTEMAERMSELTGARALSSRNFPDENTLELQYPFIKFVFPEAKIVAAGVPPSGMAQKMGEAAVVAAERLGRRIRVIGSTDMTHYGPNFGFTPRGRGEAAVAWVLRENDAMAVEKLVALDIGGIIQEGLTRHNMCCAGAAAAAAAACKKQGAVQGVCLDRATSFETSRSESFVGYCGVVFPRE